MNRVEQRLYTCHLFTLKGLKERTTPLELLEISSIITAIK
jgi:hypothetical protein